MDIDKDFDSLDSAKDLAKDLDSDNMINHFASVLKIHVLRCASPRYYFQ